ncbi:MAG TPA: diguanylate cyclase [Candidatus Limiplasma sp.]|nr:diguanylate cyclase [Candidatus Limiplasma sp.]
MTHTAPSRQPNGDPAVAMALCEADGRVVYLDSDIVSMLTLPPAAVRDLNLFGLLADPHDLSAVRGALAQNGAVQNMPASLRDAHGQPLPVSLSISRISLDGRPHLFVIFRGFPDCCALSRQTEARYHLIFNSVPVGITITDQAGHFIAFNPAFNEMTGYSPAQLRRLTAQAMYQNPEDRKVYVASLRQNRVIRNYESVFVRADGKRIHVLQNSDLIDFGEHKGMQLSSIRDISPMKSIEAELIKERNFSEAVLDTSDSLIMVYNRQGRLIKFNKACEKTSGYTMEELKDTPFWDLIARDPQKIKELIKHISDARTFQAFECHLKTKDGRALLIKCVTTALVDEDGNDYIVTTGSDITENRRAHEAERAANRELEQSLQRLEEHNRAIRLLADMEGLLQGCRTLADVCTICAQFVRDLCPRTDGAVYLLSDSKTRMQAQETWGEESRVPREFVPTDCWSVRRGRPNLLDSEHRGLPCPHIHAAANGQYLCLPMEANGEMLGILHAAFISDGPAAESTPYFAPHLQLLTTAAETAALSLGNIMLQNTLRQQSIHDELTGIYNRRYMVESLLREISRAQREQTPVSVLMFDIDYFKDFNDTYGHDGGDLLLRYLGEFLKQNTRGEDIVCRYGGEEFVVVLPNTPLDSGVQKADTLRLGVSRLEIPHLGALMRTCTISIGVAVFPQDGQTADALLKAADDALYTAKRTGRNRVMAVITGR